MNHTNWTKVKASLKENFINIDFAGNSSFNTVDFDKVLDLTQYILAKKSIDHDETVSVIEAINSYAEGIQNKDVLEKLVSKFEPFCKKLHVIIGTVFVPSKPGATPALGWCLNQLFAKQVPSISRSKIHEFFDTGTIGTIESPSHDATYFRTGFLTDGTPHGEHLHRTYHLRNSNIHNDKPIITRQLTEMLVSAINSYLYVVSKYYNELTTAVPDADLIVSEELVVKNLASLSGGAYNPIVINQVLRDGVIHTIENKLANNQMLFLDGAIGIGKTTIIKQFIEKHPNNCFSYFIDGNDKNTYSIKSILRDLSNQLHFHNSGQELNEDRGPEDVLDETTLHSYFHSTRIKNKGNQSWYIILDGLSEIPEESIVEIKEQIIDLLPTSQNNTKIILTGSFPRHIYWTKFKHEIWEIPLLSYEESKKIFGTQVTESQFAEINKICGNNAGKIVFIRDLMSNSGISAEIIISKIVANIEDLYSYIWNSYVNSNDNIQGIVLAIIAFEGKKYSIEKISKILSSYEKPISEEKLIEMIGAVPFIRRNSRNTYEFMFEGFTSFARKKLTRFKKTIDNVLIEYLLNNFGSKESLTNLPEHYLELGQVEELIKLLGGDRWKELLQASESISDVSRVSTMALQAVHDQVSNKNIPTVLKYSVLKSSLSELSRISIWQHEIAANLSLGDELNALNLAHLAFLKEDRLKIFASIAKTHVQKQKEIPSIIQRTIRELFDEIDFNTLGTSSLDLASLLMYSNPKLAFRLIEQLSGSINDDDNAFDWALAQISLNAYVNNEYAEDVSREDVNSKVYSKIRNPKIKEFADAIVYLTENKKYDEIIVKINDAESTAQKLFIIRNWISNNSTDDSVADIIELGISTVVSKSDHYIPKASDFKSFAQPLPHIKDKDKALGLVATIEKYIVSMESTSSTLDLVQIRLRIAECICNFDFGAGEKKFLEAYNDICKIFDRSTKSACLATFCQSAKRIKSAYPESDADVYSDLAREEIEIGIDNVLEKTALHFEIVRSILIQIVSIYPETAIRISEKLNKSIDRDNAFLESLSSYLDQPFTSIDFDWVFKFYSRIADLDIQRLALVDIVSSLSNRDANFDDLGNYHFFFEQVDEMITIESKCNLYVDLISIFAKDGKTYDEISRKLSDTWCELESSANKIELGFELAYRSSFLDNKDLARKFLDLARDEKDKPDLLLDSPNTANVFFQTLELAIRVSAGLVSRQIFTDKDLESLDNIISSLPSDNQQIELWSTFVLRIVSRTDDILPKKVINTFILPKLAKIKNRAERIEIIIQNSPVLYLADPGLRYLDEIPYLKLKDVALSRICKYLLSKCLPNDLCEDNGDGFVINFETLKKVLGVIKLMSTDYFIAYEVARVRRSVLSPKTLISSQQSIEVKRLIEEIASDNLPDINNIKHGGYQLLLRSYALSIQKQPRKEEWMDLLSLVEKIPNLADRIFLWIEISALLPSRTEFDTLRLELTEQSITQSYNLPSFLDTVGRLSMVFTGLIRRKINGLSLKELITEFVNVQRKREMTPKLRHQYRDILDAAYSTDPGIAKIFINLFDDDPARRNTGSYLGGYMKFLDFQAKLTQGLTERSDEKLILEADPTHFHQLIDRRLARLNASRIGDDELFPKDLLYQLNIASRSNLADSFNIYSYFIERMVLKYENTSEAEKLIRKSFSELLEVCSLVKLLSIRNADKIKSLFDILSLEQDLQVDEDDGTGASILDTETHDHVVKLKRKDFSPDEISSMLRIEIGEVHKILDSTDDI